MRIEWTLIRMNRDRRVEYEAVQRLKWQLNTLCLHYVSSPVSEHIAVSSSSISRNFASRRQRTRHEIIIRRFFFSFFLSFLFFYFFIFLNFFVCFSVSFVRVDSLSPPLRLVH